LVIQGYDSLVAAHTQTTANTVHGALWTETLHTVLSVSTQYSVTQCYTVLITQHKWHKTVRTLFDSNP